MKKKIKTGVTDASDQPQTGDDGTAFLNAAFDQADPSLIITALRDMVQARGTPKIAKRSGLGRVRLLLALSPEGNPDFTAVLKVINALELRLHAVSRTSDPSV